MGGFACGCRVEDAIWVNSEKIRTCFNKLSVASSYDSFTGNFMIFGGVHKAPVPGGT